jgi:hypothetical protein
MGKTEDIKASDVIITTVGLCCKSPHLHGCSVVDSDQVFIFHDNTKLHDVLPSVSLDNFILEIVEQQKYRLAYIAKAYRFTRNGEVLIFSRRKPTSEEMALAQKLGLMV